LKFVYLGFVMQRRRYVSYYSRPAGDENEYDDVIPGFDRWSMPIRQQRSLPIVIGSRFRVQGSKVVILGIILNDITS
jgi:hypothetical protein